MDKMLGILKEFDLDIKQNFHKMSYGQKKKFLIAFALSTNCKAILLDEPTNGLDIPSKTLFRKVLAGAIEEDQTVIISTHQVKDIENLIDNIIILDLGKAIFNESIFYIIDNYSFLTTTNLNNIDYLYSEKAPGGYNVIPRKHGHETPIDIELLFNALNNGIKL